MSASESTWHSDWFADVVVVTTVSIGDCCATVSISDCCASVSIGDCCASVSIGDCCSVMIEDCG